MASSCRPFVAALRARQGCYMRSNVCAVRLLQKEPVRTMAICASSSALVASEYTSWRGLYHRGNSKSSHVHAGVAAAALGVVVGNAMVDRTAASAEEEAAACTSKLCSHDSFATMADEHGVRIGDGVQLQEGENGRGLFAAAGCSDGSLLLRVPVGLCLFIAADDPEMHEESGGLGWSFWMMLKLLQISDGNSSSSDPFWQKYRQVFMPSPEEVLQTIPIGMPLDWLEAYADIPVIHEVVRLRHMLTETCERLAGKKPSGSHTWGLAAVLSRCFALDAASATVGLIPFVDMLNHNTNYNAKLRVDQKGETVFVYATRDLAPGEELFISYANNAPNKALYMKYGFTLPGGSADDTVDFPSDGSTLSGVRVENFLKVKNPNWDAELDTRTHIVLNSLPIIPQEVSVEQELEYIAELKKWLAASCSKTNEYLARKDNTPLLAFLQDELATLNAASSFLNEYETYLALHFEGPNSNP